MTATEQLVVDSPFTLEEVVRRPYAGPAEVDRVLDRAQAAARAFRKSRADERAAICLRATEEMERRAKEIALDVSRMMGKPLKQALGEVAGMAKRARHMIAIAEFALHDKELPFKEGFVRKIAREPLGVVLDLPAWNYPLLTAVNVVVPAVLAGNAVVLKHSPRSPLVGEHFADAFAKAGAPEGLVQALHATYPVTEAIAADPRVDHVAFTGSVLGGHRIYQAASARFVEVGLELGGKDGAYVAEDADVEHAIESLVDGACYNAGQSCCAIERVYVHEKHYARFVEGARELLAKYVLGDPMDDATTLGPIAQPWHPAFLKAQIEQARARGAKVLLGGDVATVNGKGRFFQPTLLTDVAPDLDVMRVETFGPVLPVVAVRSDDEALARINDSDLGLTAAIYTRDLERAERMARDLEVGTVYMNQCDTLDPALPWTGRKDSGKGSTLSELGFLHLTRPKAKSFKLLAPKR